MRKSPTIVSLLPSATEIVCALGLQDQLVGRSHECDFPSNIAALPTLSRAKIDAKQSSQKIDQDVRAIAKQGLSIYEVNTKLLKEISPDVIVTQDQCEVCAVSLKDVEQAVCQITAKETKICSLQPDCLADIFEDFLKVGNVTGKASQAATLIQSCKQRLEILSQAVQSIEKKPKALCIEWLDPPMIGGGWIPELVNLAGAEPLVVTTPKRFETVKWSSLAELEIDFVVIMPCGFPIEQTTKELNASPGLAQKFEAFLTKGASCVVCDGNAFFNRPGPRIVDSAEILSAIFHANLFPNLVEQHQSAFTHWRPK